MAKLTREELLAKMGVESFTACEEALLEHDFRDVFIAGGEEPGKRPEKKTEQNCVWGAFLRELILGNIEEVDIPEDGVKLLSLWVEGDLDLLFANIPCPIGMIACEFEADIKLLQAKLPFLELRDSRLTSLAMDRAEVRGNLNFKNIQVHNELRLAGAHIGGQLDCDGAEFEGGDTSINADGAEIKGSVFMKSASAKGEVRFLGAQIGAQLNCTSAEFEGSEKSFNADGAEIKGSVFMSNAVAKGEVRFNGAQIGGQLVCIGAKFEGKLNLQKAKIEDGCYFLFKRIGGIDANFAQLQEICDRRESWPEKGNLILNGATYSGFVGGAPNDAKSRLEWLELMKKFEPQPYRQLAKVFRSEGKSRDANEVLYVMEDKLAERYHDRFCEAHKGQIKCYLGNWGIWSDRLFGWFTGYGYKNYRAIVWIGVLIFWMFVLSYDAYLEDEMVPNSDVILTSKEYGKLDSPLLWVDSTIAGQDWESFNPLIYSADVVIPLINFRQEEAWAPSRDRGVGRGAAVWAFGWIFKLMGWVIATIGIASATGLLQSRHGE